MRLLYFSPVDYHSYSQRPHYMVRYFLARHPENKVLWVNPYPTRFPELQDFSRLKFNIHSTTTHTIKIDNLDIISPKALPIEPLSYSEKINNLLFWHKYSKIFKDFCDKNNTILGIGRPSKFALLTLQELQLNIHDSFYDAMDNFPEFYSGYSRSSMSKIEKKISGLTQKIFVSSSYLATKFSESNTVKIFNGYDMTSLPSISNPITKDSHQIIFGFIGTIGKWFDWPVVINLAQQFPNAVIRLIGPQYLKYSGTLPKNIEFFPECPQSEAINYLNKFTVGLIPFKQNTLTQAIDPIKYYEYRAMGLPVISTHFGEMNSRNHEDGVYFFDECNQDKIKEVLSHQNYQDNQNNIEYINLFREKNDWKTRFSLCGFSS